MCTSAQFLSGGIHYVAKLLLGVGMLGGLVTFHACVSNRPASGGVPANDKPAGPVAAVGLTSPPGETGSYPTDARVLARGRQLFETHCAACHNFNQKGIGPNLAGVTASAPPAWLARFVRNAPEVIQSGDQRAARLFAEYNQYMPPFTHLGDPDLQAILAYVHAGGRRAAPPDNPAHLGAALADPVSTKIPKSGWQLVLEAVATAPASAEKAPLARINKMAVLPGKKERVFIEDLRGKLYELDRNGLREWMDMAALRPGFVHAPGLATGFGSYAFHPDFARNGRFYTTHTEKPGTVPADFAYADSIKVTLQWVLTEWQAEDPAGAAFAGTGREMLRVNVVSSIHGVQGITFNPAARPGTPDYGLLYVGVGDGGAAEHGYAFLCDGPRQPWGSVLRLDPAGRNSRNGRYGIPAANPYAHDGDTATLGELFCRGFRNPNRIGWTPDGKMLITDIGHANAEELNLGVAGADYGWPHREGTFVINPGGKMNFVYALPADDATLGYTYPVAQYDHDEGNAFSGGFVYAGKRIPPLRGKYVFGDIVNGRLFYVESNDLVPGRQAPIRELDVQVGGRLTTFRELTGSKKTDLRIGTGAGHELFLYTKTDGRIYRVKDLVPHKVN
ncbi:MAG TPA: PQQ-dependent sugar dehydrogenase [Cytophagales bacterium]